ncbi:Rod shape-determining protein MreD [Pseudochryseolinea flava]|uniref:Rod shape-determining protein MreD n=1 Tax=Pseudochryseolinea flava TaxID=2059302 RepID=A0A364Y8U2_9BACT|nr:Rod shape-determining protein MreD [Pseudochryseolinea flava]
MPVETNPLLLMGIGFAMGFVVDLFYESLGLHAFACVMVMYARNYWLNSVTPQGGYDNNAVPSMALGGVQWFLVYTMPLIFLHHAMLFYIEAGGFGMFWFTLWKVITSTIFTTLVILIAQFLFPSRRR